MKMPVRNIILLATLGLLLQGCLAGEETKEKTMRCELPDGEECVLEGKLNGASFTWEMGHAWSYEGDGLEIGIRFRAYPAEINDWPYRVYFPISPGVDEIVLEEPLILDNYQRLDDFDRITSHTKIEEIDDDLPVAEYTLQDGDTSNHIVFTHYEEIPGERFQAVVAGKFVATYYYQERDDLDPNDSYQASILEYIDEFRRLPDTVRIRQGRFRTIIRNFEDSEYWAEQEGDQRN